MLGFVRTVLRACNDTGALYSRSTLRKLGAKDLAEFRAVRVAIL